MRPADNPFAAERIDALRFRPQGPSWPELLARLEGLRYRAAIVGPEGSGKTTLLEELHRRLTPAARLLRLRRRGRPVAEALAAAEAAGRSGEILLVDSAEVLGPVAWLRLRRRARGARGLVVTVHRPGRLPTLLRCRTSPELLEELAAELAPGLTVPAGLDELWRRHRGDLRRCLRELYDQVARESATIGP